MTNEIAVPSSAVAEIDKLYAWVDVAQKTHQVSLSLAKTSFVPASMRGKAEEITACIMAGRELGLEPMSALRAIDIIDGNPTLRALAMRAIAQSRGHEVWVEESTMNKAVVCGIRAGTQNEQTSVWTIERAKQAGLTGKSNWTKNPTAMLVARATSELCRLIAADALLAMPYSSEEMRDERDVQPQPAPAESTETKTFRRDPGVMPPADNPEDLGEAVQAQHDDPDWPEVVEVKP